MHTRIMGHLRDLEKILKDSPSLQRIVERDFKGEITPSLRSHFQDCAFVIGCDLLELNRRTVKIVEENKHDVTKIRRRIEEHLRKYATHEDIIGLALYLGVPVK